VGWFCDETGINRELMELRAERKEVMEERGLEERFLSHSQHHVDFVQ